MCLMLFAIGILERLEEAVGGVGGDAGMKSEGIQATVAMMEMTRTMVGTSPRTGLMSWASYSGGMSACSHSSTCFEG